MNEFPRAIGWNLVVQPTEDESDIWLPEHITSTRRGVVVSVGACVQEIEKGDVVLFGVRRATKIMAGREEFWLASQQDVHCVLDEPSEVSA